MRVIKWISLGLGALVALVVLGVLVIVWLVDPNKFKPTIESRVREATGRQFRLSGDIELGFFPWLALRTGEGHFGNAPEFGPDPMVSWKSAQLGARLFPLLRGQLVADRVKLVGADLRLTRNAEGLANWEGMGGDTPADPNAEPMDIRIDGIEITDSRVLFVDEAVPRRIEVTALNLSTEGIAPGKPFTDSEIAGVLHMTGFAAGGVPFSLEVPHAELPFDATTVKVEEFRVTFGEFAADGSVSGTLGESPQLEGRLKTREFDPRAVLISVGIAPPSTTDASALGKLGFDGAWTLAAGAISIDPFNLTLDDTRFSGNFHRGAGEAPVGEFALRGDSLDIGRYLPPEDPASEPFVLPTAMIKGLLYRGTLELEHAKLGDIDMKGVTLRLLLDEDGLRSEAGSAVEKPTSEKPIAEKP